VVDYYFRVCTFLIDASASAGKALRADIWVIGLVYAADLATTTWGNQKIAWRRIQGQAETAIGVGAREHDNSTSVRGQMGRRREAAATYTQSNYVSPCASSCGWAVTRPLAFCRRWPGLAANLSPDVCGCSLSTAKKRAGRGRGWKAQSGEMWVQGQTKDKA
jgi:hypothetical protein